MVMVGAGDGPKIPHTLAEVHCQDCNQLLTDPKNAVVAHNIATGGLMGKHKVCPPVPAAAPEAPEPFAMTADHERLLLTVARILRARLPNLTNAGMDAYLADDLAALNEALAPFDPNPGPGQNTHEEKLEGST